MNQQVHTPLGEKFYNRQYDMTTAANTVTYSIKNLSSKEAEHVLNFVLSRVRDERCYGAIMDGLSKKDFITDASPLADLPK